MTEEIKELFDMAEQTRIEWEEWLITDREYAERITTIIGMIKAELK